MGIIGERRFARRRWYFAKLIHLGPRRSGILTRLKADRDQLPVRTVRRRHYSSQPGAVRSVGRILMEGAAVGDDELTAVKVPLRSPGPSAVPAIAELSAGRDFCWSQRDPRGEQKRRTRH